MGVVAAPKSKKKSHTKLLGKRIRINRILMRKRRQERTHASHAPHLMVVGVVLLTLVTVVTSSGVGAAYAYYQSQLPLLNGIAQHSLFQTTHIYDRNGKLLHELYDNALDKGRRTYVNYKDISPYVVNATVAAEDHSFWSNSGVDYVGIARAGITNLKKGSVVEGGSTITQQLIKNQFFVSNERSVAVKGEEAILATGLTQQYPKWKIMEMYLNTVFYGDQNYGVEAAAQKYFGLKPKCEQGQCKPATSQLTLGQASLLAGLPQSPSAYMPLAYKEQALNRQKHVLGNMVKLRMITPQQKEQAQKEMANYRFKNHRVPTQAPHFVDYLIDQVLIPLFGAQNLKNGGYKIYTSLDLDLQKKVEQITHDHLYEYRYHDYRGYNILSRDHNVNNAGVVVMDPATGEILAMNGSADYDSDRPQVQGQYNIALSKRQPGSSFKPIVYATAFEMGWYPAMNVPDFKTYFPDGIKPYSPQNYDQKFRGQQMTIRRAVANSFNIPAIEAIEYTGVPNVLNLAGRLGMTNIQHTPLERTGAATALGSNEETLLNMTGAYATFANNGLRVPTTAVLQIVDNQGKTVYKLDRTANRGQQVIRPEVAFLINSVLSDKAARYEEFGPNNPLELDRPAAAKTGTTDSFRDNWTLGYTPHLAVGVWAGNSNNEEMNDVIGITGAAPIWKEVMTFASKKYNFPADDFKRPANVVRASVSSITGLAPRPGEPTVTDWFIEGTQPTLQGSWYYIPPPVIRQPGGNKNYNGGKKNQQNNNNNVKEDNNDDDAPFYYEEDNNDDDD